MVGLSITIPDGSSTGSSIRVCISGSGDEVREGGRLKVIHISVGNQGYSVSA